MAQDEVRRRGYRQLTVGFNWVYRLDPATEESFWSHLARPRPGRVCGRRGLGGARRLPRHVLPPGHDTGRRTRRDGERDVEPAPLLAAEGGDRGPCPDPRGGERLADRAGRPEDRQVDAMRVMVGAVHDFRGTFNVTDYRWFDLRDHNTASANFQHHYGLLRDDYSPKPAFEVYRRLVGALARREVAPARTRRPRPRPAAAGAPGASGRATVPEAPGPRRGLRRGRAASPGSPSRWAAAGDGDRQPASRSRGLRVPRSRLTRVYRVRAVARLRDGRRTTLARTLRACPR